MTSKLTSSGLAAYSLLAVPLALAALPVYVHIPNLYASQPGFNLTLIGLLLLGARLIDALLDPLLGWLSDQQAVRSGDRRLGILLGAPLFAIGLYLLFTPTSSTGIPAFCIALVLTYVGFSAMTVAYESWGAEISTHSHYRTQITAGRGAASLAGVLIAAALPAYLTQSLGVTEGFARFALYAVGVVVAGTLLTCWLAPAPQHRPRFAQSFAHALALPWDNPPFRALALVYGVNALAAAIPGTLFIFFVSDVIGRPDLQGQLLVLYFLAAIVGLPLWVTFAKRWGKSTAWGISMLVAVTAFASAALLGKGQVNPFIAICFFSGLALGADLALPPSLLADLIDIDEERGLGRNEGAYFGFWALLSKLALALAAGIALPLVAVLGYEPTEAGATATSEGVRALGLVYAVIPCLLKLLAIALLYANRHQFSVTYRPHSST